MELKWYGCFTARATYLLCSNKPTAIILQRPSPSRGFHGIVGSGRWLQREDQLDTRSSRVARASRQGAADRTVAPSGPGHSRGACGKTAAERPRAVLLANNRAARPCLRTR